MLLYPACSQIQMMSHWIEEHLSGRHLYRKSTSTGLMPQYYGVIGNITDYQILDPTQTRINWFMKSVATSASR